MTTVSRASPTYTGEMSSGFSTSARAWNAIATIELNQHSGRSRRPRMKCHRVGESHTSQAGPQGLREAGSGRPGVRSEATLAAARWTGCGTDP
ncbi:hypothetical protein GCM10009751_32670 [Myceligenerans crystallogenes]|uniref:Uncharacterized protein n=1 Tax=Myceligenerans crystallogenes TaxID=316335 RepID=A0ABN2NMV4_9MICO